MKYLCLLKFIPATRSISKHTKIEKQADFLSMPYLFHNDSFPKAFLHAYTGRKGYKGGHNT